MERQGSLLPSPGKFVTESYSAQFTFSRHDINLRCFFLACEDLGRIFNNSFPSALFFLKWRLACAH